MLEQHSSTLHMFNAGAIEARVKAFVAGKGSPFSTGTREAVLQPGEPLQLTVTVRLDDAAGFSDTLHILVENGDELQVQQRCLALIPACPVFLACMCMQVCCGDASHCFENITIRHIC